MSMQKMLGLASLSLSQAATVECPQEVMFEYFQGEPVAVPHIIGQQFDALQKYTMEPSLKNGRSWYSNAATDLAIYWCAEMWHVVPKVAIPTFELAEIPVEECRAKLSLIPIHEIPADILANVTATTTEDDKNFTCVNSAWPAVWSVYNGSEFIPANGLHIMDSIKAAVKEVGETCSDFFECKSGKCTDNICVCTDDDSIPFPNAINEITLERETQNCSVFATESNEAIAASCGCSGKASYYCQSLCGTCNGIHNMWNTAQCSAYFNELLAVPEIPTGHVGTNLHRRLSRFTTLAFGAVVALIFFFAAIAIVYNKFFAGKSETPRTELEEEVDVENAADGHEEQRSEVRKDEQAAVEQNALMM